MTTSTLEAPKTIRGGELQDSVNGTKLLGSVVCWSPGYGERTFDQVKTALTSVGFDSKLAAELTPRNAFGRAAKRLREERVIDIVREDAEEIVFQFSKRNRVKKDDEVEVEYRKENYVRLNKTTGQIKCANDALRERAQKELDRCMVARTSSDVSRIVQRLMERQIDLVPIRDQGGVYFVPQRHFHVVNKVNDFLKPLGGEITAFPVPEGTTYGDRAVQTHMAEYLDSLIKNLDESVEGFKASTRHETIKQTAARVNECRLKVEAYANLLQEKSEGLLEKVNQANGRLVQKIKELTKEGTDK